MDSEHGLLSPDGRHRWDAAERRWVEVGAPAPGQPLEGWRAPLSEAAADPGATSALPPSRSEERPPPGWGESPSGWGRPPAAPRPWEASPPAAPRPWEPSPPPAPAPGWGSPSISPTAGAAPSPWARSSVRPAAAESPAVGGVVAAIGGAGLVIGAFLAWITATYQGTTISQKGIDTPAGDGWFFVAVGITICAAGVATLVAPNIWLGALTVVGALACGGLTVYEFSDVHGHISDAQAALGADVGSYGPGLYLLAGACVLVLAGGVAEAVRGQRR